MIKYNTQNSFLLQMLQSDKILKNDVWKPDGEPDALYCLAVSGSVFVY